VSRSDLDFHAKTQRFPVHRNNMIFEKGTEIFREIFGPYITK
jgi:hypothetical protein